MDALKSYILGLVLSAALILAAYIPVSVHLASHHRTFEHGLLVLLILALAVVQALIQLRFFLHLGKKSPGWTWPVLLSTLGLMLILVIGSIWIMNHLNSNMTPMQMNQYLENESTF